MVKAQLAHERVGATTFWLSPRTNQFRPTTPGVWLLPNYDEFTVGYRDRSVIFDDRYKALVAKPQGNIVFANVIVADGEVVGTWEKAANRGSAEVSGHLFVPLDDNQRQRLIEAVGHCGRLKELPNELRVRIQEMRKAVRDLR